MAHDPDFLRHRVEAHVAELILRRCHNHVRRQQRAHFQNFGVPRIPPPRSLARAPNHPGPSQWPLPPAPLAPSRCEGNQKLEQSDGETTSDG